MQDKSETKDDIAAYASRLERTITTLLRHAQHGIIGPKYVERKCLEVLLTKPQIRNE